MINEIESVDTSAPAQEEGPDAPASAPPSPAAPVEAPETDVEVPGAEIEAVAPSAPLEAVETVEALPPRLFLTTPFEEYTVTEGFLLVLLLCAFIAVLYHFVRRFI